MTIHEGVGESSAFRWHESRFFKKHIWSFRQTLVNDSSFHIFGIAKTRLGPEVDDCHVGVPGYSVSCQDYNLSGRGILLYLKKKQLEQLEGVEGKVLHNSKTNQ